jgi:DNA-binding GntR family transcriptional regulator
MSVVSKKPGPVSRATLSDLVTQQLRESILSGAYEPGAQLNETTLARQLGVSRGPLREAIQRLVQEGLLTSRPRRGVFVPELTNADRADIYFAREAIETATLKRVIESGRAVELAKALSRYVDAMVVALEKGDWGGVIDHDLRFHCHLVDAAESPRLSRLYASLIAETRLCLHVLVSGWRGRKDFVEEHRALTERLAAEDTEGAMEAARRHLREPLQSLVAAEGERTNTSHNGSPG